MAKFIKFEQATVDFNGKACYLIVNKRSGNGIGNVFWYPGWRKYAAVFSGESVWSEDCLADVRAFILSL